MSAQATLNAEEWYTFIKKLMARTSKVTDMLSTAYGTFGYADIMDHFRQESGSDAKWPKRSAATNAMYDAISSGRRSPPRGMPAAAFRSSNKLLQLTGFLRQSITPKNPKKVSATAVQVIANAIYSGRHDEGLGTMPQREFMWLSDDAKQNMAQYIVSEVIA